jgi:GTP-binding protein
MRASGKDEQTILTPIIPMTLEWAMEFIRDDEQVEVTPKNIRLRKNILPAESRKQSIRAS